MNLEAPDIPGMTESYLQQLHTQQEASGQSIKPMPMFVKARKRQALYNPVELAPYDKFTTALPPQEEQKFLDWRNKLAPHDSGADYDLRGAFKAGLAPNEKGHWPDTYKKPNHPTFSTESIYGIYGNPGTWGGPNHDQYIPYQAPSPLNPFAGGVHSPVGRAIGAGVEGIRSGVNALKNSFSGTKIGPAKAPFVGSPSDNAEENRQLRELEQQVR